MRIISKLFGLVALLFIAFGVNTAQAAQTQETNETKINFEIEDHIILADGMARNSQLSGAPFNFDGYEPVKSEEEKKREKVLNKYADDPRFDNLPEGRFQINASAYTAAADECGKSDGITASGLKVRENETIACPPNFPFGAKLKIDGMGTFICQDRGGAIKGNHIDIYMETKSQAFAFGRKNLWAEVVN